MLSPTKSRVLQVKNTDNCSGHLIKFPSIQADLDDQQGNSSSIYKAMNENSGGSDKEKTLDSKKWGNYNELSAGLILDIPEACV